MLLLDKVFKLKDEKSKTVLKNAFVSFFIKGLNIAVNFLTIPLVLSFLTTTQYGIWLTLTAILNWFSLFDLGFGNGLRNHLTIAVANKNWSDGKIFVSTTYACLSLIFGLVLIIFFGLFPFISWANVFNAPANMQADLTGAVMYAISLLFVQFVIRLINTLHLSYQRSAMADFINTTAQVFILIGLFVLKILGYHSLESVSVIYSAVPVAVFVISSGFSFLGKYKLVRPSFAFIKLEHAKKLLQLGLSFFIIQISALILYASDNFIIAHLFQPSDVTVYNVTFKYYSLLNIILSIFLAPFWSMTTHAYVSDDLAWIKKNIMKLMYLWIILLGVGLIQLASANTVYKLWTHNTVFVPFGLSCIMLFYFTLLNWASIYSNFLNAVGKVRMQLYFSVIAMFANVPLAIIFVRYFHLGILGVPFATIITMISGNIIVTIQYKRLINKTALGIWDK